MLHAPRPTILANAILAVLAIHATPSMQAFGHAGQASPQLPNVAQRGPQISQSIKNDRSHPLREIVLLLPERPGAPPEVIMPEVVIDQPREVVPFSVADSVVQATSGEGVMPSPELTFEGLSSDDNAAILGFRALPPDTNGDVGPSHYMQTVNLLFAVYDKTGTRLLGPLPNNAMWAGFGGPCETQNAGDPIVLYDHLADRWLFSQFTPPIPPYHQCFAVSTTGDPTGEWYRYDFLIASPRFNDYPKFGVWPDAYYMSAGGRGIPGPQTDVFAFERDRMLAGDPAQAVSFVTDPSLGYTAVQPSDLDGPAPDPGTPNYFVGIKQSVPQAIYLFQFHVDWVNPAASTFGIDSLPNAVLEIAPFELICPLTRNCIPQPDTTVQLDALAGRYVMYRAQYRRFETHESIVFNHTVDAGGGRAGVRWYEIGAPGGAPFIYQQATYAPDDGLHRWMGSAAMDRQGNLAIGYSVGSSELYPSIYYAGRLATDPLSELTRGEAILQLGSGSQLSTSSRWGDYSMLAIDPTDDCSFWYTTEYVATTDVVRWQTRIGKFTFTECALSVPVTVAIDIRPGRFPNRINPSVDALIRVAVLTDGTFDATTIDPTTVRFGMTGTEAAPLRLALRDVDGDGDTDAILRFAIHETGIVCGTSSAFLTGKTFSGQAFKGSDSIVTVRCQ